MTPAKECEEFNTSFPVGTVVKLLRDSGVVEDTKTRSAAFVANSGDPVIFLESVSGYYLLERVLPCLI